MRAEMPSYTDARKMQRLPSMLARSRSRRPVQFMIPSPIQLNSQRCPYSTTPAWTCGGDAEMSFVPRAWLDGDMQNCAESGKGFANRDSAINPASDIGFTAFFS